MTALEPDLPAHAKEEQGKLLPSDKPTAVLSEQRSVTRSTRSPLPRCRAHLSTDFPLRSIFLTKLTRISRL